MRHAAASLTHVILADQSELANGWATPSAARHGLPQCRRAVGRRLHRHGPTTGCGWSSRTSTRTSCISIGRGVGVAWCEGCSAGMPIAFPNLWLPEWQIEGLATWEESALTGDRPARRGRLPRY